MREKAELKGFWRGREDKSRKDGLSVKKMEQFPSRALQLGTGMISGRIVLETSFSDLLCLNKG